MKTVERLVKNDYESAFENFISGLELLHVILYEAPPFSVDMVVFCYCNSP
jgi:hypothetical protein